MINCDPLLSALTPSTVWSVVLVFTLILILDAILIPEFALLIVLCAPSVFLKVNQLKTGIVCLRILEQFLAFGMKG